MEIVYIQLRGPSVTFSQKCLLYIKTNYDVIQEELLWKMVARVIPSRDFQNRCLDTSYRTPATNNACIASCSIPSRGERKAGELFRLQITPQLYTAVFLAGKTGKDRIPIHTQFYGGILAVSLRGAVG